MKGLWKTDPKKGFVLDQLGLIKFKNKLVQNINLAFLSVKADKFSEDAKVPLITYFIFISVLNNLYLPLKSCIVTLAKFHSDLWSCCIN